MRREKTDGSRVKASRVNSEHQIKLYIFSCSYLSTTVTWPERTRCIISLWFIVFDRFTLALCVVVGPGRWSSTFCSQRGRWRLSHCHYDLLPVNHLSESAQTHSVHSAYTYQLSCLFWRARSSFVLTEITTPSSVDHITTVHWREVWDGKQKLAGLQQAYLEGMVCIC